MAYCSKCGVELGPHAKSCPLCNYELPEDLVQRDQPNEAFPEAMNAYERQAFTIRNKILYTYTIIVIAGMLISLTLNFLTGGASMIYKVIMICLATSDVLLFLLLGYIKRVEYVLLNIGLTAIIVTLVLDGMDNSLEWAHSYAVPMAFAATVISILTAKHYKRHEHTNHFIFIPVYICVASALILPFIELIISLNLKGRFYLSWSIISTISLVAFSGLLSGVYYKMPGYIKERLIRLFHI